MKVVRKVESARRLLKQGSFQTNAALTALDKIYNKQRKVEKMMATWYTNAEGDYLSGVAGVENQNRATVVSIAEPVSNVLSRQISFYYIERN